MALAAQARAEAQAVVCDERVKELETQLGEVVSDAVKRKRSTKKMT